MKYSLGFCLSALAVFWTGCAGTSVPGHVGLTDAGTIPDAAPPPNTPNCVSSYVDPALDPQHGITPILRLDESVEESQNIIRRILESEQRTDILSDVPGYIHAVQYSAFWRFPDDIEYWFSEADEFIHFRSEARLGSGDFGVNRKRMERIRQAYRDHSRP